MADLTPRYAVEQLANNAGNVQRVNTFERVADAFLGGALVLERDRLAPPGSPAEGDLYLLPASGTLTGDWSAFTNGNFALYLNAAWLEITVDTDLEGCQIHVQEERVDLTYAGSTDGWVETAHTVETAMSAAGTTQGAGTAITAHVSEFTTVTASTDEAATLPTARAGDKRVIRNAGAATLKLFPATGDAIDTGAANASIDVAADSTVVLWAVSTSQWYSLS